MSCSGFACGAVDGALSSQRHPVAGLVFLRGGGRRTHEDFFVPVTPPGRFLAPSEGLPSSCGGICVTARQICASTSTTAQVRHIRKHHPGFNERERIPDVIEQGQSIPIGNDRFTNGPTNIHILPEGDSYQPAIFLKWKTESAPQARKMPAFLEKL